jgi:hypothetical protein
MKKHAVLTAEEILEIVKSAIGQCSHQQPSPITLERMAKIEDMIHNHASDETKILESIQKTVETIIKDQGEKHTIIENQLNEIKPLRDGLVAAGTIRNGVLWVSGFVVGVTAIVYSWKQILR